MISKHDSAKFCIEDMDEIKLDEESSTSDSANPKNKNLSSNVKFRASDSAIPNKETAEMTGESTSTEDHQAEYSPDPVMTARASMTNAKSWMGKVLKGVLNKNQQISQQGISTISIKGIDDAGNNIVRFSYPDITSEFTELVSDDSSIIWDAGKLIENFNSRELYSSLCQTYACKPISSLLQQLSEQPVLVYSIDLSSTFFDSLIYRYTIKSAPAICYCQTTSSF